VVGTALAGQGSDRGRAVTQGTDQGAGHQGQARPGQGRAWQGGHGRGHRGASGQVGPSQARGQPCPARSRPVANAPKPEAAD
jgi:hypothetical protein